MHRLKTLGNVLTTTSRRLFGHRSLIADAKALADFIDGHSAFVVQKGIYEYSRARAGHYSKVLFKEQAFLDAVDRSRWSAYPIGLAMVGELAEGVLRPTAGEGWKGQLEALAALVLSVFDRYPLPAALDARTWSDARGELARRLQLIGLHPPKRAFEVADPYVRTYFNLLPIHEELRQSEFPTIRGYLRATLCNVHEELTKRIDAPAVAASLRGPSAVSGDEPGT